LKVGRKRIDKSLIEGKSIVAFREATKTEVTLEGYERRLVHFLRWAHLTSDEFVYKAKQES